MKKLISLFVILCLMIFISCDESNPTSPDPEVVVGSGTRTSETPSLDSFHTVILEGIGDIHISEGAEQAVTVDADDNIHQYLILTVNNGVLTIKTEEGISFSNVDIDYWLTMTDLEKVSIAGAGNVSIPYGFERDIVTLELIGAGNINAYLYVDTLTTNLIGAGNIYLAGSAKKHKILLSGTGGLNCYNLVTNISDITISGIGDVRVYVSQTLIALITGIGNIYYNGSPTIEATITGVGSIISDK